LTARIVLTGVNCGQLENDLVALGPIVPALQTLVRHNRGLFYELDAPVLLAIASRESGLQNIEGERGKGIFQIPHIHKPWLASQYGCRAGTYTACHEHSAAEVGYVPDVESGALFLLHHYLLQAWGWASDKHLGRNKLKFVLASYNAGLHMAIEGWRVSGSVDSHTTGGNYAEDVLDRAHFIQKLIVRHGLYATEERYARL
jgi:hypothetical protein